MKKLFLFGLIALFTIVACQQNEELTDNLNLGSKISQEYFYLLITFDDGLTDSQKDDAIDCISRKLEISIIENLGPFSFSGAELLKYTKSGPEPIQSIIIREADPIDDETYEICNARVGLN